MRKKKENHDFVSFGSVVGLIWVWFSPFSSFVDFGILSLIIGDLCFAIFKSTFSRSKKFSKFFTWFENDFLGF